MMTRNTSFSYLLVTQLVAQKIETTNENFAVSPGLSFASRHRSIRQCVTKLFKTPSRSIQRDLGAFSTQLAVCWSIGCQMEP